MRNLRVGSDPNQWNQVVFKCSDSPSDGSNISMNGIGKPSMLEHQIVG